MKILLMNLNNAKYILRNYMLQNAIDKAKNGDYSEIENLLILVTKPFQDNTFVVDKGYDIPATTDSDISICVSCSS